MHYKTGLSLNPVIPKTTPNLANTTTPVNPSSVNQKIHSTAISCDCGQVAPSFFDAPGAQDTSSATAGVGSTGLLQPAPPSIVSLASVQRLSDELPNITFAFASEVGYKVKSALMHCSYPSMHLHARAPMSSGTLEQDHMDPASVTVMSVCVAWR